MNGSPDSPKMSDACATAGWPSSAFQRVNNPKPWIFACLALFALLFQPSQSLGQAVNPIPPPLAPANPPLIAPPPVAGPANNPQPPAPANQPAKTSPTFLQIMFSGGPLGVANMLVLIGLSLTAVYLVIDNALSVRQGELIPDGLKEELRACIARGEVSAAEELCRQRPSFLAQVASQGLAEADSGWSEVEKAMEDAAAEQTAKILRKVEYLSVIGNLAPMVGLLGTVTGMLLAFKEVADSGGRAGADKLADGIYQALVTTVVGLIIAIPALAAFALFRSRVDQLAAEAAYAALHAVSPLKRRGAAPPASAALAPPAPPRPPGAR